MSVSVTVTRGVPVSELRTGVPPAGIADSALASVMKLPLTAVNSRSSGPAPTSTRSDWPRIRFPLLAMRKRVAVFVMSATTVVSMRTEFPYTWMPRSFAAMSPPSNIVLWLLVSVTPVVRPSTVRSLTVVLIPPIESPALPTPGGLQ